MAQFIHESEQMLSTWEEVMFFQSQKNTLAIRRRDSITFLKTFIALLVSLILVQNVQAKIKDFNELIKENMTEQKKLGKTVHSQLKSKRQVHGMDLDKRKPFIIADKAQVINAPTDRSALKFDKEKHQFERKEKPQQERVANEVNDILGP